jgi:hypothetical protein
MEQGQGSSMQPAVNQGGHRQGARRQGGHSGQEVEGQGGGNLFYFRMLYVFVKKKYASCIFKYALCICQKKKGTNIIIVTIKKGTNYQTQLHF